MARKPRNLGENSKDDQQRAFKQLEFQHVCFDPTSSANNSTSSNETIDNIREEDRNWRRKIQITHQRVGNSGNFVSRKPCESEGRNNNNNKGSESACGEKCGACFGANCLPSGESQGVALAGAQPSQHRREDQEGQRRTQAAGPTGSRFAKAAASAPATTATTNTCSPFHPSVAGPRQGSRWIGAGCASTLAGATPAHTAPNADKGRALVADVNSTAATPIPINADSSTMCAPSNYRKNLAGAALGDDRLRQKPIGNRQSARQEEEPFQRQQTARLEHPLDAASLISKLLFGWMFPFIWRGWRFGLKLTDMPGKPSASESCSKIGEQLVAKWEQELKLCAPSGQPATAGEATRRGGATSPPKAPKLVRALLRAHYRWILANSLITFFSEVVCKSVSAYSVGQMLFYISKRQVLSGASITHSNQNLDTHWWWWWWLAEAGEQENENLLMFWTIMLVSSVCLWVLTAHFYGFQMMRVGLHIRVGCSYLIYRKSLKLGLYESSQTTMGKMINMLSNDLDKFNYTCIMIPFLWIGPIQTIVSLYLLWPLLGLACLGPILVLSVLTPIQFYLSRKFASFRRRIASFTDERIRLLNETITALKLIKLYGWEYSFREAMAESRRRETDLINRVGIIKGISVALMYVSSKLVLFITIIFHCLIFGNTLDAQTLFMSMAMLNNVQFTMTQLMPRVVSLGVESLVSLQRVTEFLLTKEHKPTKNLIFGPKPMHSSEADVTEGKRSLSPGYANIHHQNLRDESQPSISICSLLAVPLPKHNLNTNKRVVLKPVVEYENVSACWPSAEVQTLTDISFKCEAPGLIIICGQVASSKSSLLMSLLNEIPIIKGKGFVCGSYGFCCQTAWIFNGTVKDNILFGLEFHEERYREVVEVCALRRDFDLLEFGDRTYIQENSLSGGQKARLNLARCLYRDCDIYLLDDPFSAIDGQVSEYIFKNAIKRFLANKLVFLVTHQIRLIQNCDRILLLDQGRQLTFCDFPELCSKLSMKPGEFFSVDQSKRLKFLKKELGNLLGVSELKEGKLDPQNTESKSEQKFDEIHKNSTSEQNACHDASSPANQRINFDLKHYNSPELSCFTGDLSNSLSVSLNGAQYGNSNKDSPQPKHDGCHRSEMPIEQGPEFTGISDERKEIRTDEGQSKTSESIHHAPYGFENFASIRANEDKNLITNQGAAPAANVAETRSSEQMCETTKKEPFGQNICLIKEASAGEREEVAARATGQQTGGGTAKSLPSKVNKMEGRQAGEAAAAMAVHLEASHQLNRSLTNDVAHYRTDNVKVQKNALLHSTAGPMNNPIEDLEKPNTFAIKDDKEMIKFNTDAKRKHANNTGGAETGSGPVDEESSSSKMSSFYVWYKYYTQTSKIRFAIIIFTFLITQTLFTTVDIYLTVWSLSEQNRVLVDEITRFNQQTFSTFQQNQLNNNHSSLIISYDFNRTSNNDRTIKYDSPLLTLPLVSEYIQQTSINTSNSKSGNGNLKILGEIERASSSNDVSISPLSSHSSYHYYSSEWPKKSNRGNDGHHFKHNAKYLIGRSFNQQRPTNYRTISSNSATKIATGIAPTITMSALAYDSIIVPDGYINDESESALDIKTIYRPLYVFVNNFTSGRHALTYAILLIALFSSSTLTNILSLTSSNKSAISLYKKLTDNALFAKLIFFDQNPIGRFLNRATRDIGIIDEAIPYNANQAYDAILQTVATFMVVTLVDFRLALPSSVIVLIFVIFRSIHVEPTKNIQRMEGIQRSPIISHISTTLDGIHTIRATKSENRFTRKFIEHQDSHTSLFLFYLGCNRSMAIVLDSLNAIYTAVIAFWAVMSGLSGPSAGLVITSAMILSGLTQHGVMKLTETESLLTSVERVIEYCNLPQEEGNNNRPDGKKKGETGKTRQKMNAQTSSDSFVVSNTNDSSNFIRNGNYISGSNGHGWLIKGFIEYRNVDLYHNSSEKPVLKNISFKLNAGEKVGIVGRTGSGKSSIISALFRLYDYHGTILIDDMDTKEINLIKLRSSIGIIPQEPILFSTTIRKNLDPFESYDDFKLWSALDRAHLRETVSALPGKLDYVIGRNNSGGGFSTGQKQLICLARILLRQNNIIVLDEATANVDPNTDAIIQTTVRREFKQCTVITIAHRLETILDCDRIMVLDAGRIVDFDSPEQLAARSGSYIASMLQKSFQRD